MKIIIGRAIEGISLNGVEFLLNEDGSDKVFNSKEEAKQFLRDWEDIDEDSLEDDFIYLEVPEAPLFKGTIFNPNEKVVTAISKRLEATEGYCPCDQGDTPKEDTKCPCKKYRTQGICCCTLYVKAELA